MKKNSTMRKNGNNDKVLKYKNLLNGEVVLSKSHHNTKFIDGVEFLSVYRPTSNGIRPTYYWMRKDKLQLVAQ
jgi:hypothetical protein